MGTTFRRALFATAAVVALTATACSDDESSSDTTSAAETTAAETTVVETTTADTGPTDTGATETTAAPTEGLPHTSGDQTAKVMVLTDVTQGQIAYSAPETYAAVQAAFTDFPNVEVSVCDAKGDQNEYLNCQTKAVDDGVDAVVVGWSAGGQAGEDTLYEAGIPVLGGPSVITNDLAFAFSSGSGSYVGLGAGAVEGGGTKIGTLYLEGTDNLADMIKSGVESQGGEEVSRAAVPFSAPDLAPAIAKLLGDGADLIVLSVTPPMVVQAMTAIDQSGETPMVAAIGAILPQQLLDALGPLSEGILSMEPALRQSDDTPVLDELQAAMAPFDDTAPISVQSTLGFVSGYVLATAIANLDGEVSGEAIVAELDKIQDLDLGGIVHPVSCQPLDSETLSRFMNPYTLVYQIENGVAVKKSDFIDLHAAIEG